MSADAQAPSRVLYEPFGGFVLGDEATAAGAAGAWERRQDAPLELRIALGENGQPASPAHTVRSVREAVHYARPELLLRLSRRRHRYARAAVLRSS